MKTPTLLIQALLFLILAISVSASQPKHPRIALVDTGVSAKAISSQNIGEGKNYILPDSGTNDVIGHGTALASVIVGCSDAYVDAVCKDAVIVPLVYCSETPNGEQVKGDSLMLARIIREAVDVYDCDIVNISSGTTADCDELRDAVAYAEEKGVVVVSSVGNDGNETVYFPAAYETVLSVGALNSDESASAYFSNRNETLDVSAKGERIPTATMKGNRLVTDGTSFSAAYVSGVCARLVSQYPLLSPKDIRKILCDSAQDVGEEGYDICSGWGKVDVEKALIMAENVVQQKNIPSFEQIRQFVFECVAPVVVKVISKLVTIHFRLIAG